MTLKYPRVLLKLSGEALAGEKGFGIDFDTIRGFARQVKAITELGAQVGMVIGGGRGGRCHSFNRCRRRPPGGTRVREWGCLSARVSEMQRQL